MAENKTRPAPKDETKEYARMGELPSTEPKKDVAGTAPTTQESAHQGHSLNDQIDNAKKVGSDLYNASKEKVGDFINDALPPSTKKFWDNGCHGQPANLLEAILAIFARLFDSFKGFDPTHPLDFITGSKNDPNSVENLSKKLASGELTVRETKTFLAGDGTVQSYHEISRAANTPTWVQLGKDGNVQSVIMKEGGSFSVYDYDPKSGNYGTSNIDPSTNFYKQLRDGDLPDGFTKTTYEEFLEDYKGKITPNLLKILRTGGSNPDTTVRDKDGNPVSASEVYYDQLKPVEKAFADAISDHGKYRADKAVDSILKNKISFEDGHVYIDMGGDKAPVREDILRNLHPEFWNSMQSYLSNTNGVIYHDSDVVVNIVNYKGHAKDISVFNNNDLANVEFANKHSELGLQGRTLHSQVEYAKGLLQEVYGMSEKESEAMVKEVLFKKNDVDPFGNSGLGLAFKKGQAFYETFQELQDKVNKNHASKDELHAYDEMNKFLSGMDKNSKNFENEIGLKLIFSNPRETIRDYLGEGNLSIQQVPYASEAKKKLVLEHFLNAPAVDEKTIEQEKNGVNIRVLEKNIAFGIKDQNYDTLTVGSNYKVAIGSKDLQTLNYLLQPGNEKELKEFIARLADKHLGGKDMAKHLEEMAIQYKKDEWSVKKGDSITFNIDEKGNLSLIFGNDNGVKVSTNQGLDMDNLNARAAKLNDANFEREVHTYNSVDYSSRDR